MKLDYTLNRNAFGRLVLNRHNGLQYEGVVPVRAFPLKAPDKGIALVDTHGREQAWIEHLTDLPEPMQQLIAEELENRELMPDILKITHVSSTTTPCTWTVETNRGTTCFTLQDETDIRRIQLNSFLVTDSHGVPFLIRKIEALDRPSRRFLECFI